MIRGYKAVYKDGSDNCGMKFEEGKHYHCDGEISFGQNGEGIHFCERMEDTFRFVDGVNREVLVAQVVGDGKVLKDSDNVYDYDDMYLVSDLSVERVLGREEIVQHFLETNELAAFRFITGFRLTEVEREMFKLKFADSPIVQDAISYYQEGDEETYYRRLGIAKVKKVGEVNAQ